MEKVFKDYAIADVKALEGFMVAEVHLGGNAKDTGIYMELERTVDNVTLGIDVIYDPDHEDDESEFAVSNEYVKYIE